jgi:hypothetical protein
MPRVPDTHLPQPPCGVLCPRSPPSQHVVTTRTCKRFLSSRALGWEPRLGSELSDVIRPLAMRYTNSSDPWPNGWAGP